MTTYFDQLKIGDLTTQNRIWLVPSPSGKSQAVGDAVDLDAEFYGSRATAGVIVAEGVHIYRNQFRETPRARLKRLHEWKEVTEAVHVEGGIVFCQLWHHGLAGGQNNQPSKAIPDEAIFAQIARLSNGPKVVFSPIEMTAEWISQCIQDYAHAARLAALAGFDGVEIIATGGTLPHRFFSPTLNSRDDNFGGGDENRSRLLLDIFRAVAAHFPPDRIGVRIAPRSIASPSDPDPTVTYKALASSLDKIGAGYLHFVNESSGPEMFEIEQIMGALRPSFSGPIVANCSLTIEEGADLLATGKIQARSFSQSPASKTDLVARIALGKPLTDSEPDESFPTTQSGAPRGVT